MMAYLTMMAQRMVELHRVLRPTGSIFLHCDPTASHYLKLLLDAVFGVRNFRNEIIWKRADTVKGNFGQGARFFDRNTDTILFYSKSDSNKFVPAFSDYSEEYKKNFYKFVEEGTGRRYRLISMTGPGGASKGNPQYEVMGVTRYWRYSKSRMQDLIDAGMVVQTAPGAVPQRKQYLDEGKGVPVQSLWDDIPALHSQASERLGYPTQKPESLLERIIRVSTEDGDVVLDPFCGCGTTISVAERLKRRWIGIDITHLAIALMKRRLEDTFDKSLAPYEVIGQPQDVTGAAALATQNRHQFEWWAVDLVGARPAQDKRKGADQGVDGYINFFDDNSGLSKRIVVQVKSGHVGAAYVRDLKGVMQRDAAEMGVLVTLEPPTKPMLQEAAAAGLYSPKDFPNHQYPKLQILTIDELLAGKQIHYPRLAPDVTFRRARRRRTDEAVDQSISLFEPRAGSTLS